jgi:hypothetical protein
VKTRRLGELWPVSSLALGGGLGQLWGTTSRDEAVATMREAIDAGIDLLDVAPRSETPRPSASSSTRSAAGCRQAYGSRPSIASATRPRPMCSTA